MSDRWINDWEEGTPYGSPKDQALWFLGALFAVIFGVLVIGGSFLIESCVFYNVGKAVSEFGSTEE